MEKTITLSPQELYYIGTLIEAKYYDFAYVTMMVGENGDYKIIEGEAKSSLLNQGYLIEDFSGNLTVSDDLKELVIPVFMGNIEVSIEVCDIKNNNKADVCKIHRYQSDITVVEVSDGALVLHKGTIDEVENKIRELSSDEDYEDNIAFEGDPSDAEKIIAIKVVNVGVSSDVYNYVLADGKAYQEKNDGLVTISGNTFVEQMSRILKEVF